MLYTKMCIYTYIYNIYIHTHVDVYSHILTRSFSRIWPFWHPGVILLMRLRSFMARRNRMIKSAKSDFLSERIELMAERHVSAAPCASVSLYSLDWCPFLEVIVLVV